MRIGIIGTRGIPNQYGGYEQFAEYAAPELVRRGHAVTVYNSSLHPFTGTEWKGVQIVRCYDPENKIGTAGQFIYDLNCILDARKRKFDIILQLGYTSSSIWTFLFPKRSLLVTNMDGLEWKRSKYSTKVKNFLKRAERWAVKGSDYLIADSVGIQQYLKEKYGREAEFIAYGAEHVTGIDENLVRDKGLQTYAYDLVISRMEPENSIEAIIQGHLAAVNSKPLVIIGNYGNEFGTRMYKQYASDKIRFLGAIYDTRVLDSLRHFSYLYFHGHSVGGTNPSLLEAMASGSLIAANDNIFNRSVLLDGAFYFTTAADITAMLNQGFDRETYRYMISQNETRIRTDYSWAYIIDSLENYFKHVMDARRRARP